MTEENGLSGNMLYSVRYQQMLYEEKDIWKEDFAIMKLKKEKRIFLEENGRAVREIERQKDHELEKTEAYNKREHKRLLVDARAFIKHDEKNRVANYVDGYCKKIEDVTIEDFTEKVPVPVPGYVRVTRKSI